MCNVIFGGKLLMEISILQFTDSSHISISFGEYISIRPQYNIADSNALVNVSGVIARKNDLYSFDGNLVTDLVFSCDRCLNDVTQRIVCDISEKFTDSIKSSESSEDEVWLFTGNVFDLKPAIETNLLLHMPTKVLCKDDCKGLCNICGQDLNERNCDCDSNGAYLDPKFLSLRSLFDDKEV